MIVSSIIPRDCTVKLQASTTQPLKPLYFVSLQLFLGPLPQLLRQLVVPCERRVLTFHSHGPVERSSLDTDTIVVFGQRRRGCPGLIQRTLTHGLRDQPRQKLDRLFDQPPTVTRNRTVGEVRVDHAGMHADHGQLGMSLGQAASVVDVGQFRLPISRPGVLVVRRRRFQAGKVKAPSGCHAFSCTAQIDDSDIRAALCRVAQYRQQHLGEKSVSHMIRAELNLVTLLRQCRRTRHDPGIVHENVESLVLSPERCHRRLDRIERSQVALEEFDQRLSLVVLRQRLVDFFDGRLRLGSAASRQVDPLRIVLDELMKTFSSESDISSRHKDHYHMSGKLAS